MGKRHTRKRIVVDHNLPAIAVGIVLIILFAIYAAGFAWSAHGRQRADYVSVMLGNIENYTTHRGIIVREERLFRADTGGTVVWLVDHGQRVRIGEAVASLQGTGSSGQNMVTDVSGVVSFVMDGMEENLTTDRLRTLTIENTNQIAPQAFIQDSVNAGAAAFKVVTSNTWYIAAYINISYTAGWIQGTYRTIYIEKDGEVVALRTRLHMIDNAGLYDYVVFGVNNSLLEFIDKRSISFRLHNVTQQGLIIPQTAIAEHMLLMIPNSCIHYDEEGNGFVLLMDNTGRIVPILINVLLSDDEGVFVLRGSGDLQWGDAVLDYNGDIHEISEVRIRRGIYVLSSGVTRFREVNLDYSIIDGDYIILNRALNTNIRIGDNVMIDASNITDGQIFF